MDKGNYFGGVTGMSFGKGYIQVYTGDGKGKTTAAIGLAIRALGAGKKVLFLQFMKDRVYSEHNLLPYVSPAITVETFGKPFFIAWEGDLEGKTWQNGRIKLLFSRREIPRQNMLPFCRRGWKGPGQPWPEENMTWLYWMKSTWPCTMT